MAELAERETAVPVAVMTYYNLVFRWGHQRCADELARAGVAAAILPGVDIGTMISEMPWCFGPSDDVRQIR